jgi:hypothetical protein
MYLLLAWGRHMPPQLCMCRRRGYSLSPYSAPHNHREALGILRHSSLRFALHVAGLIGSSLHSKFALENQATGVRNTPWVSTHMLARAVFDNKV